ncbi:MAG TPA: hypothetical protein GX697_01625, partial [Firmicutes bacterium]|nr:hypothetical protein [Bacillota bacterium]
MINNHQKDMGNANPGKRLLKIIYLPVELIKLLHKMILEKLEFSIHFRLSLSYLRIFLKAMILSGLGVLLVFGGLEIFNTVSKDYATLGTFLETDFQANLENIEHIGDDPGLQSAFNKFSLEEDLPLHIYDQNKNLLLSTKPEFKDYKYRNLVGIVRTQE